MVKRKRLLWQLYPSYLVITVISLLAAMWFASHALKEFYFKQNAEALETRARILEDQILKGLDPLDPEEIDRYCKRIGDRADTRITVILPSGRVVGDSLENPDKMDSHFNREEVKEALAGRVGVSIRYSSTLEREMMYVGVPLKLGEEVVAVVRMSLPTTAIEEGINSVEMQIFLGGLITAVLAAIVSLLVSRRITRPLVEMEKGARLYAKGDLAHRLRVPETEEMAGLAEAMNRMAAQLDDRMSTVIRQRRELEAVFSSMVEGVLGVDLEEKVINLNQAAGRLLGIDLPKAQGRNIQEVVRKPELQRFIVEALSRDIPLEKDIVLLGEEETTLRAYGTALQGAQGERSGVLIVLNDVTRLRKLETIRKEFVANVSHEIKTPITAIKGFVETLMEVREKTPEETERFLGIIQKHVDRLQAIVEDLMSLSRIEQEAEEVIQLSDGNIRAVLQTAMQVCEGRAKEKEIAMDLQCPEDIALRMDPPLLEQAMVNLLDNAVKYSEPGKPVHVVAEKKDQVVVIHIQDQGRGISKEHLPRLFERFYRVDKARSRQMGGTGLGLAIVKHIVEAHGGRVEVESALGRGSTFTMILPVE